jgi:hypothetical protein
VHGQAAERAMRMRGIDIHVPRAIGPDG